MTPTAEKTAAVRAALKAEFSPFLIGEATRGLTLAQYARAFDAGASRDTELDLDDALARYMSRGQKSDAPEHAWLDGNTWNDEAPEDHLRSKLTNPEQYN